MSLMTLEHRKFVGIDVGQVNDHTAIIVVDRVRAMPSQQAHRWGPLSIADAKEECAKIPTRFNVVHVDRIPLGTLYPQQVDAIVRLLSLPELRDARVGLDATGVGRPVLQMLRKAGVRNLHGVTITGAQSDAKRTPDGWNVGKAELMNGVQVAMQTGLLRFSARVPLTETLVRELKEFRSRQNPTTGNLTFNAREGQNDDILLALSYANFLAARPVPVTELPVRWAA